MRFRRPPVPWCGKLAAHQEPGEPSAPPTRKHAGQPWRWLRKQMNEYVGRVSQGEREPPSPGRGWAAGSEIAG